LTVSAAHTRPIANSFRLCELAKPSALGTYVNAKCKMQKCETCPHAKRNKKKIYLLTILYRQTVHKQQIDYVLAHRKWRNSIQDVQAYNSFASVGSDKRVVSARVRLSLRVPRAKSARKTKYIWKALEGNDELQERYAVKVRNNVRLRRSLVSLVASMCMSLTK